jgi:hypothetical protein
MSTASSCASNSGPFPVDADTVTATSASPDGKLPIKAVRLTAVRVERLVASLERIATVLASLGAETREVNRAIKLLLRPTLPDAQKRKLNPSAYNLFIRETMPTVRAKHPEASAKERMQMCAALWKQSKEAAQAQAPTEAT